MDLAAPARPTRGRGRIALAGQREVGGTAAQRTARIAGLGIILFGLASLAWFVLELVPPSLGFEDTDSPAVMIAFVRAHPAIHVFAGIALVFMAIALTVGTLGIRELLAPDADALAMRSLTALGLFAAAFFLVSGGLKVGASGPLLHFAELQPAWGEAAFVAYQVADQALLISGVVGLCVWAVGLSFIGLRTRVLPVALCVLGIIPAFRLAAGTLGPLGALPDIDTLWVVGIIAIPGTMVWCLLLGIVLFRRGFGSTSDPAVAPATVAA